MRSSDGSATIDAVANLRSGRYWLGWQYHIPAQTARDRRRFVQRILEDHFARDAGFEFANFTRSKIDALHRAPRIKPFAFASRGLRFVSFASVFPSLW